ncbi:MAG: 50S ribosomal protein L31 [Caldilineales bacterium]|nr:50S ribosomal protein L31 [Caldilineales bacterium]
MKEGIHPKYYPAAIVVCSCGNTWTTGSTKPEIHTDVCSACHPFFTGEQRIVDTAGQVDRFMKRLRGKDEIRTRVRAEAQARTSEREVARKARARGDDPDAAIAKARKEATNEGAAE